MSIHVSPYFHKQAPQLKNKLASKEKKKNVLSVDSDSSPSSEPASDSEASRDSSLQEQAPDDPTAPSSLKP